MSSEQSKIVAPHPDIKYDRDGIPIDNPALRGLKRYFNNSTIRGRANVAKATFIGLFGYYVYSKIFSNSNQPEVTQLSSSSSKSIKEKDQIYWEIAKPKD